MGDKKGRETPSPILVLGLIRNFCLVQNLELDLCLKLYIRILIIAIDVKNCKLQNPISFKKPSKRIKRGHSVGKGLFIMQGKYIKLHSLNSNLNLYMVNN